MKKIGAYEAKTHLSRILEQVAAGERYTITKHGVPVAILQPYDPDKREDAADVIKAIHAFRAGHTTGKLSIQEMIAEGRK